MLNTKNIRDIIYLFLVKILAILNNPQITKARSENFKPGIINFSGLSMLVEISEAICLWLISLLFIINNILFRYSLKLNNNQILFISTNNLKQDSKKNDKYFTCDNKNYINTQKVSSPRRGEGNDDKFNEWLAGLIDGDGCFLLSKKGYASLEIVMQLRDKRCLYLIKQKYGGSVKLHGGYNYLRYRLHHKTGLLNLINGVNGLLRNPVRIIQLGKICDKYNIKLKDPKPLTYFDGWLSGFFDSDGSIYLNDKSGQIFITASQKNRYMLDPLVKLYGGQIYTLVKQDAFKWICYRKKEILSLINDYFKVNPCRSEKLIRLTMANKFYELRQLHAHRASPNSDLGKVWKHFLVKWNNIKE